MKLLLSLALLVPAIWCAQAIAYAADAAGEAGMSSGAVSASDAGAPVYPGKPINGGLQKMTLYSKPIGTTVTFSTPDAFGKVNEYYTKALRSQKNVTGETIGQPPNQIATYTYTKSDGSEVDIEIKAYPGHTNYGITHTYKK